MTSALDFIVPSRFDIAAKTLYAWHRVQHIDSEWAGYVYAQHLKVWNGFHERDPPKNGLSEYQGAFDSLIDSIMDGSFIYHDNSIPLANHNHLRNGSHRVAASIICNRPIPDTALFADTSRYNTVKNNFNYRYFRDKKDILPNGIDPGALDAMALEYCRILFDRKCLYIALLFPSAQGRDKEVDRLVEQYGNIVYNKLVYLFDHGPANFIQQIYSSQNWVGDASKKFSGAYRKAERCFSSDAPMRVYLIQSESIDKMKELKRRIRKIYDIGNDSIHICDTIEETIESANILFNKRCIDFLNYSNPSGSLSNFWSLMSKLKHHLKVKDLDPSEICVGGSAPMAAYGIRDVSDFDVIHRSSAGEINFEKDISSHMGWMDYYGTNTDSIIFDPRNYFWYNGIKFCTLDVVREMKIKRWERKDRKDIAMINSFINNGSKRSVGMRFASRRRRFSMKAQQMIDFLRKKRRTS